MRRPIEKYGWGLESEWVNTNNLSYMRKSSIDAVSICDRKDKWYVSFSIGCNVGYLYPYKTSQEAQKKAKEIVKEFGGEKEWLKANDFCYIKKSKIDMIGATSSDDKNSKYYIVIATQSNLYYAKGNIVKKDIKKEIAKIVKLIEV